MALCILALIFIFEVHPFLAVNQPINAEALVIEGWIPDRDYPRVLAELNRHEYRRIFTTGGSVAWDDAKQFGGTYAGYCARQLYRAGFQTNAVTAVPSNDSGWERTFHSALALQQFFKTNGSGPSSVNIITVGPHARRTRLLFERAFGNKIAVGVISLPRDDYDPGHWWRTSAGVREVVSEAAAYAYCRLIPSGSSDF